MAALHISLLGGFEARLASGEALPLKGRKTQALLAYLAVGPGEPRSREELVALFWGDRGEEQARSSLRQSLSELRKALGEADHSPLIAGRDAVSLDTEAVDVDVTEFERLIDDGTPTALERAAELYRGDLLDGIGVHDPAFEDWLRDECQRLTERASGGRPRKPRRTSSAGCRRPRSPKGHAPRGSRPRSCPAGR